MPLCWPVTCTGVGLCTTRFTNPLTAKKPSMPQKSRTGITKQAAITNVSPLTPFRLGGDGGGYGGAAFPNIGCGFTCTALLAQTSTRYPHSSPDTAVST